MRISTVLFILFAYGTVSAQISNTNATFTVEGVVMSESSVPIQGATIQLKDTFTEVVSDENGNFSIDAEKDDVLMISAFAMYPKQLRVTDKEFLKIVLTPVADELGEVKISQKREYERRNVVGGSGIRRAFGIDGDIFREYYVRSADANLFSSLGNVPGLYLVTVTDPARSGMAFIGNDRYLALSAFMGSANPPPVRIIIDDVLAQQHELLALRADEIENIMVVKDRTMRLRLDALYGSSGGGFLLVDTKYGKMASVEEKLKFLQVEGNDYEGDALVLKDAQIIPDYLSELQNSTSFEEAKKIHKEQQLDPANSGLAYYLDTSEYFRRWDLAYSEKILDELFQLGKENPRVLLSLAYHYEEQGNLGKATYLYQELIELQPERIQSYRNLANIYTQTGKLDLANTLYRKMLFNDIPKVDFTPIEQIIINEYRRFIAHHKAAIDYEGLPSELLIANFKKDVRMVFEWNNPFSQFEVQMVSPENKYYTWKHSEFDNSELIAAEIENGFAMKEFIIDDAPAGNWIVNISSLNQETENIPTYIKYTIYSKYGLPEESKQMKVLGLNEFDGKVTLDAITQKLAKSQVSSRPIPSEISIFWDASFSGQFRNLSKELSLLREYLNFITSEGNTITIDLTVFAKNRLESEQFKVTNNSISELETYLKHVEYHGPTDYSEILKSDQNTGQIVIIFTDGNSFGIEPVSELEIPVFAVSSSNNANHEVLNDLAFYSGGFYIDLSSKSIGDGAKALLTNEIINEDYASDDARIDTSKLVYGVVHTKVGPLEGATVRVKNSFTEVRTGNNGMYKIPATTGDVLEIRALGMIAKDTIVANSKKIHIPLEADGEILDLVTITAKKSESELAETPFGEKKKAAIGYSLRNTVNSEDIGAYQVELWQVLQTMPGVVIANPGEPIKQFAFRKTASNSFGLSTLPAIVLNGVIFDQASQRPPFVNPQEIESITLLKSLAATVKYGQLAANGAIVIELKKGQAKENVAPDQLSEVSGNSYSEQVVAVSDVLDRMAKPYYVQQLQNVNSKEEARERYMEVVKKEGVTSVAFFLKTGNLLMDWDKQFATEVLFNITEVAPENVKALKSLCYSLESHGLDKEATAVYERILFLAPDQVQSYLDLARNYKDVGHYERSATLYKQMINNSIPKVDFTDVAVIVFNELKQLVALHKSKITYSDIPVSILKVGFKKDVRIVLEWNDPMADFEVQFVNPEKKFFPYSHSVYGDFEKIQSENKQGISIKEFDIEESKRGDWLVNIKYSGGRDEINPTLLKYTLYKDYGLPSEERMVKVINLQEIETKVTLDNFVY